MSKTIRFDSPVVFLLTSLETKGKHAKTKEIPEEEKRMAVEDAVENRSLYRVFVSRLF